MTVSIVIRLVPAAAADGVLAGEIQRVDTGEIVRVRDAAELVAALLRAVTAPGA